MELVLLAKWEMQCPVCHTECCLYDHQTSLEALSKREGGGEEMSWVK